MFSINGKNYNHVFTAGNYPQGEFSIDFVKQCAAAYDPLNVHIAPLFVGHRSFLNQDPAAFAWVDSLVAVDDKLYASFSDISNEARDLIDSGKYKKCSVEIGYLSTNDGKSSTPYLFAIALTNTPQVAGLPELKFSKDSTHASKSRSEFTNLSFFSNDNLSKIINPMQKINLKNLFSSFSAFVDIPDLEVELNSDSEFKKLSEAISAKFTALSTEISKLQDERSSSLVEFAIASGKILPKDKEAYLSLAKADYAKAYATFSNMKVSPDAESDQVNKSHLPAGDDISNKFTKPDGSQYTYDDYLDDVRMNNPSFKRFSDEDVDTLRKNWKPGI